MQFREFLDLCVREIFGGRAGWVGPRILKVLFSVNPSRKAVLYVRLAQYCRSQGSTLVTNRILYRLVTRFGIYLEPRSVIGAGLRLPHPTSIVIGKGLRIGKRCLIYQQVTLGAAPRGQKELMDRVGDDVTLYPGAKIVGAGRVGNRVVVGANAVVTQAFGDDVVVAGVPARIVRSVRESDRVGAVKAS